MTFQNKAELGKAVQEDLRMDDMTMSKENIVQMVTTYLVEQIGKKKDILTGSTQQLAPRLFIGSYRPRGPAPTRGGERG